MCYNIYMKSRSSFFLIVIIVIIAAIAIAGYFMDKKTRSVAVPVVPAVSTTTVPTTDPFMGIPFPTVTSTADTSSWETYTDRELGYSVSYPSNIVISHDAGALILAFPKSLYFHWPLQDDAKLTITVASTCPAILTKGGLSGPNGSLPEAFSLNGLDFNRMIGTDVAAGNRYFEIAYDTVSNGFCYHMDFLDHGANGAGLYVDDSSLIKRYDDAHTIDLARTVDSLNAIVGSFRILAQKP